MNRTLEVQFQYFNLDDIVTPCRSGSCTVEVHEKATTCDDSNIDSEANRVILLKDLANAASEIGYINVGRNIEALFDRPISIRDNNGTVLACTIFTEIEDINTAAADSPSGAMGSTVGLAALVVLVSSFVTSFVLGL